MKYKIAKAFKKQVDKINDSRILTKIRVTVEQIGEASLLQDIPNLEPLKGFPHYYRIKFDYRYRIGIYYDGGDVEILKVGSREGFYKEFP
ncbi:MAG: type II toxin-antitoxin system RelE/ParE family toxin [Cyanobacteria bacterium J06636_16]